MKNYKRKIQLIAGSTYSISLPKEWINLLGLKSQDELNISETPERDLVISVSEKHFKTEEEIVLYIEDYSDISQILLTLYYYGFETIKFLSKKDIDLITRKNIREILVGLSGTEIIHEDKREIVIQILSGQLKMDFFQILSRINLMIDSSIETILEDFDWKEIKLNEDEVDRLYNLSVKILTLALENKNILHTSKINELKIIPSLFLISKRLENIADNLKKIARFIEKEKGNSIGVSKVLILLKEEMKKINFYFISSKKEIKLKDFLEEKIILNEIKRIEDDFMESLVFDIFRYFKDIKKEIISVNFYNELRNKS